MDATQYEKKALGCLIGSAYGDSLGAAVEFLSFVDIRKRYGRMGINKCEPAFGQSAGVITDDTQMTIATARALTRLPLHPPGSDDTLCQNFFQSYLEWYQSQSDPTQRRGPGTTCMSALGSGRMGTIDKPLNDSMGCGGIMRVHPIGFLFAKYPERAFQLGMRSAALTHGNPNGYIPAGFLAMLIALIIDDNPYNVALRLVTERLKKMPYKKREGTELMVEMALALPLQADTSEIIDKQLSRIQRSAGWMGHDALGIALYAVKCAHQNPLDAVKIAVNHSGDSDSTGAITGVIMGALYGPNPFEDELRQTKVRLERYGELTSLAKNLAIVRRKLEDLELYAQPND